MTLASITLEKVMERGEQKFKIISFNNIKPMCELPNEYLQGTPRFYTCGSQLLVVFRYEGYQFNYPIDDIINKETIDKLITIMKAAGTRLTEINKRIKEQEKTWNGTITITI